ncbi:potassium transporter Kup [bacterium]|nr:potassium transporter Kup [bacterium]
MSERESAHGGHAHDKTPAGKYLAALCLASLGVVFGDIGTSPLYAIRECFHGSHSVPINQANIYGVLSLVFWSMNIVITLKYLAYVMRADNRGEGGELALAALAAQQEDHRPKLKRLIMMFGLFGAALLYGDGMITPAISVLGAVEGLQVAAPSLTHYIVPITVVILILLFSFQRRGTAGVGAVFGPISLVWFSVLALLGIVQIAQHPAILAAVSPTYALAFLLGSKHIGFIVMGSVFLVVTGGEALYADMGHFGAKPIRLTWFILVLPALLLNYFGQGALLLANPEAVENPFYNMAPAWALLPLLLLATCATVIASQAVISGAFSITRQATMLGYWPRMPILHTSEKEIGQIYVPTINWILMVATIGLVLGFGSSANLAAAYGIAVATTMVITTILAYFVARHRWGWSRWASGGLTLLLLSVDLTFFSGNVVKITQGGWFPLTIAAIVFLLMTTWKKGRLLLWEQIKETIVPLEEFYRRMKDDHSRRVPGTAVFMTSNSEGTPPALVHNFLHNHVVHKQVVLLTIVTEEQPYVENSQRVKVEELGHGFVRMVAHYGFMEDPDVQDLLSRRDTPTPPISSATFFLGNEIVLAEGGHGMGRWRAWLFSILSQNAVRPTAFFNIPKDRVMEISSQISL